ncbi:HMG (high mobility group) box protein [Ceratobasidium sp. AG-Ba]|nr:HMG (high mobility group) box protein [Ceratobasidium sp. AG-Ba]
MSKPIPSSPVLFDARLWSQTPAAADAPDATPSPPASPISRRSVSFQEINPFISVDPSVPMYDSYPGAAISPTSTASPLPPSASASPSTAPYNAFAEPDPQPGTGQAMERQTYEGADPDMIDAAPGPSRRSSGSSRRRVSNPSAAVSSDAGTSVEHARAVTAAVKPKSHARKMSAGHILRPRNAFIIFRSTMIKEGAITENMEKDHGNISTICGMLWKKLPPAEKLKYQRMADLEKEQHRLANPGYKPAKNLLPDVAKRRTRTLSLSDLDHFDKEVAVQIKKEKEEAARLGIRPDPYATAHSAKKLKKLERERKERERALAAQANATNIREGVLAMHAKADAEAAEKRARMIPPPTSGPFSRTPRTGFASPAPVAPPPVVNEAPPSWTNPWANPTVPEAANMGRRPSSCPPPAAGAIALPALPSVPNVGYNDYVSPTAPHAPPQLAMNDLPPHHGPATAPLHHPQPQSAGFALPRRRSSSVPPPSLFAAPFTGASGTNEWGARRPSVVYSMEMERRPSQVQWNDDMGMGDARRPSMAWGRRPSAMMWTQEGRRMSAQAGDSWYGGMGSNSNVVNHLAETEPQINFGNYSFQTATNNGAAPPTSTYAPPANPPTAESLPPSSGPDQSYQFPPPEIEMYTDMNPSPFGTILAERTWTSDAQSALSPGYSAHSHAPHTPEGDYQDPRPMPANPPFHQQWTAQPIIESSPHTVPGDDEGDMFQPYGEEVTFLEFGQEGPGGQGAKYGTGETDLNAYSRAANGLGIGVSWGA